MLEVKNITVQSNTFVLEGITFGIKKHRCVSLMGPSGSGKTTILEALCGLRNVLSGSIFLSQIDITELTPAERKIALVPQDNALFDHLTVHENIAFGLTLQNLTTTAINQRVDTLAQGLRITDLLKRKSYTLSGGEAKRVALARALAISPSLLCLDEALTGLDEDTHSETLTLIKKVIQEEQITTLHVTHSLSEAEQLSDSIIRMDELIET